MWVIRIISCNNAFHMPPKTLYLRFQPLRVMIRTCSFSLIHILRITGSNLQVMSVSGNVYTCLKNKSNQWKEQLFISQAMCSVLITDPESLVLLKSMILAGIFKTFQRVGQNHSRRRRKRYREIYSRDKY